MTSQGPPTDLYEKLGAFYLGGVDDDAAEQRVPVLYDSRDLLTHAVCVGMTGSGKTGLCVGLLEEAAIDGVPAIVIDPKGDLGNLLLTFPELTPDEFEPWVSAADARRKGRSVEEHAAAEASKWRDGLAGWGQSPDRIARLRDAADFAIYTPGSSAGLPLSILKSFDAPPPETREDRDLFGERVETTVASLLGLLGIDADPVQSREHILLSNILTTEWSTGRDVDLPHLIRAVSDPPFDAVGVLDLDTFYPPKDRQKLALALNNLIASPGFAAWSQGTPLSIPDLLWTPEGRPRIAVLSIAHLSDEERMFFVALLLNEVLGWMRTQPGSTNLRALVYMDEIYGYIPPVANPPSKRPMLTLLKQARAFGVGLVLATQNPVDLDYKALSNAGTWFIGRLQTERDKARLIDALDGAAATAGEALDKAEAERIISGLGKRRFLLHNVHDGSPFVFQTRWVMSYLRGPLARDEIKRLMDPRKAKLEAASAAPGADGGTATDVASSAPPNPPPSATSTPSAAADAVSALPRDVAHGFVPVSDDGEGALVYRPALLAVATVAFHDDKADVDTRREVRRILTFDDTGSPIPWDRGIATTLAFESLSAEPDPEATLEPLPDAATEGPSFTAWRNAFDDHLYRTERLELFRSPSSGAYSRLDEDERAFRVRLSESARRNRDALVDAVREKYDARFRRIDDALESAESRLTREKRQARTAKADAGAAVGTAIFDAIFGRRRSAARGVSSTMRKRDRARDQAEDVREVEARIDELEAERAALEAELAEETRDTLEAADPRSETFDRYEVAPRRRDIQAPTVGLVWLPLRIEASGSASLACEVR